MPTVTPAFQPKPAGRLFMHALSTSFVPFAQRCFSDSLAVLRAVVNVALFIVIVFIQLALNAYGYFFKKNNRQKVKERSNTFRERVDPSSEFPRKRLGRISRTLFDPERLQTDATFNDKDREDPLDGGRSQNTDTLMELQLSAMSLASTSIAPLTCEALKKHLGPTTSTCQARQLVSHLKQRTANDEPAHYHDKKIRKIDSEYRKSQTPEEEVLVQDPSRSRTLRISNRPLVRQVTPSVFCTPPRLPKNTVTVTHDTPESVKGPIVGVGRFTYPPYPVSKAVDSSERRWPWQTREARGPCIEA
ncbi:hypothetical protein DFH29DRAFT_1085136 [Suillus ampliporus]|nr:hypothetical protein DFH29DRAFT_1085136 [Suillus ampliporus]